MKRPLLFAVAASFAVIAAGEPPPRQPLQALDWPSSLDKAPTTGVALGTYRVRFEKTTLGDVQAAFGGTVAQQGDAGEHILWLCYTAQRRQIATRIWLISDAEMGGDTHVVTAVAARLNSAAPSPDCPSLPPTMEPIALDGGIWISSSEAELTGLFGRAHKVGEWTAYRYQGKVPGKCEGGFDLTNWLAAKSEHGHLTAIYAGQVTSC